MEQFNPSCPVFNDSEVSQRFLSCLNEDQEVQVKESDVWKWVREGITLIIWFKKGFNVGPWWWGEIMVL